MTEKSKKIIRDALEVVKHDYLLHTEIVKYNAALAELDKPDEWTKEMSDMLILNKQNKQVRSDLAQAEARAEKSEELLKRYQGQEEAFCDTVIKAQARADALAEALEEAKNWIKNTSEYSDPWAVLNHIDAALAAYREGKKNREFTEVAVGEYQPVNKPAAKTVLLSDADAVIKAETRTLYYQDIAIHLAETLERTRDRWRATGQPTDDTWEAGTAVLDAFRESKPAVKTVPLAMLRECQRYGITNGISDADAIAEAARYGYEVAP